MFVKEVMKTDVKKTRTDSNVKEAAEIMSDNHIGSLVVVGGAGDVKGIVTERDILKKVVSKGFRSTDVTVEKIMTPVDEMISVDPNSTLEEAADLMTQNHVKRLPVVEEGQLVGIITATDLIAQEKLLVEKVAALLALKRGSQISAGG